MKFRESFTAVDGQQVNRFISRNLYHKQLGFDNLYKAPRKQYVQEVRPDVAQPIFIN